MDLFLYESCEELASQFFALKSSRDVADLLDIPYSKLVYTLYKVTPSSKYKEFTIPKKSSKTTGDFRTISAPATTLKIIQRKLSQVLYSVYGQRKCVHGFLPTKSIVTNARSHKNKEWVLNLDLENFFSSINFGRVRGMLMAKPYNCTSSVATVLAQICCFDNKLPQGAPTSPIISNMICGKLDSQLLRLAKDLRCTYTRYADDITYSTRLSNFPEELVIVSTVDNKPQLFLGEGILAVIEGNGFKVNFQKLRLQGSDSHQEVTGLTVNEFPNVSRKFVRQIRAMLHSWEKFGLSAAEDKYQSKFSKKIGFPAKENPSFKTVIRGKIEFLSMVRGKKDPIYLKFLKHYRMLSKRDCSSNQ